MPRTLYEWRERGFSLKCNNQRTNDVALTSVESLLSMLRNGFLKGTALEDAKEVHHRVQFAGGYYAGKLYLKGLR